LLPAAALALIGSAGCDFVFRTEDPLRLQLEDFRVESQQPEGASQLRLSLRATCRNTGSALLGAAALVESDAPAAVVIEGQLRCPALAPDESAPSADTVTVVVDAATAFDPAALWWIAVSLSPERSSERTRPGGRVEAFYLAEWSHGGSQARLDAVAYVTSARGDVAVGDGRAAVALSSGETVTTGDILRVSYDAATPLAFDALGWTLELVRPAPAGLARARVRTLDELGHPLGGVQVDELGPAGAASAQTDEDAGTAALGAGAGEHRWRFTKAGHLPVWRRASLVAGELLLLPSPRLARRAPGAEIGSLGGGEVTHEGVAVRFPPGAFDARVTATLTALTGQTLPSPLPLGWSPLAAFRLELPSAPNAPALARMALAAPLAAADVAVLARFDEATECWRAVALPAGATGDAIELPIDGAGAFALLAADAGVTAPPAPSIGDELAGAPLAPPDPATLTASASVEPEVAPASPAGRLVTGTATVALRGAAPLPSGVELASAVAESYRLAGGETRSTPPWDASGFAYQRPGDSDPATVHAVLPTRPRLLFAADELVEATVATEIRAPGVFDGSVIAGEGRLTAPGVEIRVRAGDFDGDQPAALRALDPAPFSTGIGAGASARVAFDLEVGALVPGRALVVNFPGQPASAHFVLARAVARGGLDGLEPVERFASDAAGELRSVEPSSGARLPGVTRGGRYVLVQVAGAQGVVEGVARDLAGQPASGLAVRIEGLPWLTFSRASGAYQLVAPQGDATLIALDLASGDEGRAAASVADPGTPTQVDVAAQPTGPRVIATEPASGATGVDGVTPISVTFSEPVAPASLAGDGLVLRAQGGAPVAAQLVLDRDDARAVLLPAEPLAYGTSYELALGAGVVDRSGLALEGARLFSFTVEGAPSRLAGAQLVSWEPGAAAQDCAGIPGLAGAPPETCNCADVPGFDPTDASISCVLGTAGAADPEVPVVLANETLGETATVLSNPDGSFESFVRADVDDRLSATFVNANGTRITLPLARQLFDDGSVALFSGGGILEAESDGGPVQVFVEPGAIPAKTKFRLELPDLDAILEKIGGVPPAEGRLLGGLRLAIEGDPLREPADVVIPVDPAALALPPGQAPQDRVFAVAEPILVDGVAVYAIRDKAVYDPAAGAIRTASPPFGGIGGGGDYVGVMLPDLPGETLIGSGVVVAAPEDVASSISDAQIHGGGLPEGARRVAGALVAKEVGSTNALTPGAYVAVTDANGFYAIMVPYRPGVALRATSLAFPGRIGLGLLQPGLTLGALAVVTENIVIPYPQGLVPADTFAPIVLLGGASDALPVGEPVTIPVTLIDDSSEPSLVEALVDPAFSASLVPGAPLGEIEIFEGAPEDAGPTTRVVPITLEVEQAAIVTVAAKAVDQAGNQRETSFRLLFGASPEPDPGDPLPFPDDETPPRVTWISPPDGALVDPVAEIVVRFSEAVSASLEESGALLSDGSSGWAKAAVRLSADRMEARITPGALTPGATHWLSFTADDLAGNSVPVSSSFRVAAGPTSALTGPAAPLDTLQHGHHAFTLDRDGKLFVHDLDAPGAPVAQIELPEQPRAMALAPDFSFVLEPGTPVVTATLLVVAGGVVGSGPGQWVAVIDVEDPAHPVRIAQTLGMVDPSQVVTVMRWSAPYFYVAVSGSDRGYVLHVNLQAFLLGAHDSFATEYGFGLDANRDGDFVDEGDALPIPAAGSFFGHERTTIAASDRRFHDFDVGLGGSAIVGLYGRLGDAPPQLQMHELGFVPVGDGMGSVGAVPLGGPDATRIRFDESFPKGAQPVIAVLVARGQGIEVWDFSDPLHPALVSGIDLGDEAGRIYAFERADANTWAVAASGGTYLLDRARMAEAAPPGQTHPAVRTRLAAPASGIRSFGASPTGVVVPSGVYARTAPRISVAQVLTLPVTSAAGLLAQDPDAIRAFVDQRVSVSTLVPSDLRGPGEPASPSALDDPPPPAAHYYGVVEADGGLGPEIRLAVQALDRAGRPIAPKGALFPPVMLTDHGGALGIEDAQPPAHALVARRLSDDPASELYDLYWSDPFFVAREGVLPEHTAALPAVANRQVVWSGDLFRVAFDAYQTGAIEEQELDGAVASEAFVPGLERILPGFCGEYVDSPNPSLQATPRRAGVLHQSGEFRHESSDATADGRSQPVSFARTYSSRAQYVGPIGRGWDFTLNARLCELPLGSLPAGFQLPLTPASDPAVARTAVPGDVLFVDGAGNVKQFRRIQPGSGNQGLQPLYASDPAIAAFGWNDRVTAYFESPPGEFSVLYRLSHGGFALVAPDGTRTHFAADGRVEEVIGPFPASRMKFSYRGDGKLDRVESDLGRVMRFGYYGRTTSPDFQPFDVPYEHPTQIGLVGRIDADGTDLELVYDESASLLRVEPEDAPAMHYGYQTEPPYLLNSIRRGPPDGEPFQTVAYAGGLVSSTTLLGSKIDFGGAVATAQQRLEAGDSTVTTALAGSAGETFAIDARGRPTEHAGFAVAADDHGRLTALEDEFGTTETVYDDTNPVWRFRGNVKEIRRGGFAAHAVFDQSPWNRLASYTDENGVTTAFSFFPPVMTDVTDSLLVVEQRGSAAGAPRRESTYDAFGQLQEEAVTDGVERYSRTVIYDGNDRPTAERVGDLIRTSLDWNGSTLAGFARSGMTYTLHHDALGQLLSLDGPETPTVTRAWDGARLTGESVAAAGSSWSHDYVYDGGEPRVDLLTEKETGLPDTVVDYQYDEFGRVESFTSNGELWTVGYQGVLEASLRGPGRSRALTFDERNRAVTVEDQGVTASLSWDDGDRLAQRESQGATEAFTYHAGTRLLHTRTITDATGGALTQETYEWDDAGRVKSVQDAAGTRELSYFPDGRIAAVELNGAVQREFTRDSGGRMTGFALPGIEYEFLDFDPATARPRQELLRLTPSSAQLQRLYDYGPGGRLETLTLPAGVWSFDYDGFGHLAAQTDPDGVVLREQRSPSGQLLGRTFADGTGVAYGYTGDRHLQSVGPVVFDLDDERLISTAHHADGTTTVYDRAGNPFFEPDRVITGALERTLTWEDGRLERIDVPATAETIDWAYDGLGRHARIDRGAQTLELAYDAFGNVARETSPLGSAELAVNAWNQRDVERYPSGLTILHQPDAAGLSTTLAGTPIEAIEWLGPDTPSRIRYAGGLDVRFEYDASLRFTGVVLETPAVGGGDPTVVSGLRYQRTPGGRFLSEQRLDTGRFDVFGRSAPAQGMRIRDFRLGAGDASGAGAQASLLGFSFDADGELQPPASTSGSDPRAFFASFTTAGPRLASVDGAAVGYDADGSVTSVPLWVRLPGSTALTRVLATLSYDGFGLLRAVARDDGVAVEYGRDGMGRIAERRVTGPADRCRPGTWRYAWMRDRLLEEYDASGASPVLQRRYVYLGDDLVLAQVASAGGVFTSYVPLVAANGSVRGWSLTDGTQVERIDYGPYGLPVFRSPAGVERSASAVADTLLFHAAFHDPETGLYQMGERDLHPLLGRFLQRDSEPYLVSRALFTAFDGDPAGLTDATGRAPGPLSSDSPWAGIADSGASLAESWLGAFDHEYVKKPLALTKAANELYSLGRDYSDLAPTRTDSGTLKSLDWTLRIGGTFARTAAAFLPPEYAAGAEKFERHWSGVAKVVGFAVSIGDLGGGPGLSMGPARPAGRGSLAHVSSTSWAGIRAYDQLKRRSKQISVAKGGVGIAKYVVGLFWEPATAQQARVYESGAQIAESALGVAEAHLDWRKLSLAKQLWQSRPGWKAVAGRWFGIASALDVAFQSGFQGGAALFSLTGVAGYSEARGFHLVSGDRFRCRWVQFGEDGGVLAFLVVLNGGADNFEARRIADTYFASEEESADSRRCWREEKYYRGKQKQQP
jgi:RHS repeat-associated protein